MQFSTPVFLFLFLPLFLLFYKISAEKIKNYVLIVFSIIFYSWNGLAGLIMILISVFVTYFLSLAMDKVDNKKKNYLLLIGLVINIGFLICFKYTSWFVEILNSILLNVGSDKSISFSGWGFSPLGISFYTFSIVSYLLDIYWKKYEPQKNISSIILYVMMFPKIIMGPIVRYGDMKKQLEVRTVNENDIYEGLERFIKGLFKKVVLADNIAPIVTYAFTTDNLNTLTAWLGILGYLLQLYYDFSGYCDMAIGIGRLLGFTIPENFRHPYMSGTVGEYWRRWHATLGEWLKDYIYMPVFRNVQGKKTIISKNGINVFWSDIIALFVVWVIAGIWHGAGVNYLLYGLWYFLFIALERCYDYIRKKSRKKGKKLPKDEVWFLSLRRITTLFVIVIGQTIFRSSDLKQILNYIHSMFCLNTSGISLTLLEITPGLVIAMIVGTVFCFPLYDCIKEKIFTIFSNSIVGIKVISFLYVLLLIILFFVSLIYVSGSGNAPFLYEIY